MKLERGDIIYVPFTVTEHRGEGVDAVLPCVEEEEQEPWNFLHWEIKYAERRRKFRHGDIVRVQIAFAVWEAQSFELPDGTVGLPCAFDPPLLVDSKDLTLLFPYDALSRLPGWPEGTKTFKSLELHFENGCGKSCEKKGGEDD